MQFSVVIPSFNRSALIAETLDAVLSQTHAPAEVVVVDDASTDDTSDVVSKYQKFVIFIQLAENSGQQVARNVGIANSRSELIAFCDSDDVWLPSHLKRHRELFRSQPALDFCFSNFRLMHGTQPSAGTKFDEAPPEYWETAGTLRTPEGWVFAEYMAGHSIRLYQRPHGRSGFYAMIPSAVVVTREHAVKVGCFNPAIRGSVVEDVEFTLRCLYRGRAGAIPEPTLLVRRHDSNFTPDTSRVLFDAIALLEWIRNNHDDVEAILTDLTERLRYLRTRAVHAAFAMKRPDLVKAYFRQTEANDRSGLLWTKRALASVPGGFGRALNDVLQTASHAARRAVKPIMTRTAVSVEEIPGTISPRTGRRLPLPSTSAR